MAPHTRLEKTQPPPTVDGIILVTIDGLVHVATNEPMASMWKDQVGSNVGSWKKLFEFEHYSWTIVISCTIYSSARWSI
jgi:hypothetical protein